MELTIKKVTLMLVELIVSLFLLLTLHPSFHKILYGLGLLN